MTDELSRISEQEANQFYMMLGKCIAEWASVDEGLFQIFWACIGPYEQSALVYYAIPSLTARLRTVTDVVGHVMPKPENKSKKNAAKISKEWSAITSNIENLSTIRRRLAHQPVKPIIWGVFNTHPLGSMVLGYPSPWGPKIESKYAVQPTQHEKLRNKDSDRKPLRLEDLSDHLCSLKTTVTLINNFLGGPLKERLEAPSQNQ